MQWSHGVARLRDIMIFLKSFSQTLQQGGIQQNEHWLMAADNDSAFIRLMKESRFLSEGIIFGDVHTPCEAQNTMGHLLRVRTWRVSSCFCRSDHICSLLRPSLSRPLRHLQPPHDHESPPHSLCSPVDRRSMTCLGPSRGHYRFRNLISRCRCCVRQVGSFTRDRVHSAFVHVSHSRTWPTQMNECITFVGEISSMW
jgi:hypothetical protein